MSATATPSVEDLTVEAVETSTDRLTFRLAGGSEVSVPLEWYPRLARATRAERAAYELELGGRAVHWPLVNEDVRVADVVLGRRSTEEILNKRVQALSDEERERRAAALLAEWEAQEWDEQIAADAEAGKLDHLIEAAKREHRAGRTTPLS